MKRILLLILLPALAGAQEVQPVRSTDYLQLIHADTLRGKGCRTDSMNSMRLSPIRLKQHYYEYNIGKINVHDNLLSAQYHSTQWLRLSGSFTTGVEVKRINQLPAVQTTYVQGRTENGTLVWRGAETGELFSYGPARQTLEYNGAHYAYDQNGALVKAGTGNGQAANGYDNSIFRTATLFTNALSLQARLRTIKEKEWNTTIKGGQSTEKTFIQHNRNRSENISGSIAATLNKWIITGRGSFLQTAITNPNRNGFLSRVYQNALLTPVSFSNAQNATAGNPQVAYSPQADNPLYLLTDNGNRYLQTHRTGSLIIESKRSGLNYKLTQSLEGIYQNSKEGYRPGSAFFANGIAMDRTKQDVNYTAAGEAKYKPYFDNSDFGGEFAAHYTYTANRTGIDYGTYDYRYQRSAHDASLEYTQTYQQGDRDLRLWLANKIYASNTSGKAAYFLPNVALVYNEEDFLNLDQLDVTARVNYSRFNNEVAISRSFSPYSLVQFNTADAFRFFPQTEVAGFKHLQPIRHREWAGRLEFQYNYKITLYGELFHRTTADDVFPVLENGNLVLKNIASHRNSGGEFGLNVRQHNRNWSFQHDLSLFTCNNKVTDVAPGYDGTPIAGFSNIHTAIVKGAALGSLVGTGYLRNDAQQVIIGADGFPLVAATPRVIGNPLPRYVMKLTNTLRYKQYTLAVSWEWKQGGQVWNGTQAVLDYYGRSATSAAQRPITGYVFDGVQADKRPNTIPVAFYNVNQPVEANRWVRYGHSGVGEAYVQRGDVLRINNLALQYSLKLNKWRQQELQCSLYASNLVLYSAYKGADPNQLLNDQWGASGLDFFNLPSTKVFGCSLSLQF